MSCSATNAFPQEPSQQEDALNADNPSPDGEVAKKMKAGSLTMILLAFQGAKTEIAAGKTLGERWRLFTKLTVFLLLEIIGIIRLIPYGVRAMWIYRSLPLVKRNLQRRATQEFLDLRWKLGSSTLTKDEGLGLLGFVERLGEHREGEGQCAESMQQVDRLDEAEKGISSVTTEAAAIDVGTSVGGQDEDEGTQRESSQWRQGSSLLGGSQYQASVLRDIRYGVGARNIMDIYVPWTPVCKGLVPVVLFVHGGVWASGEKWQYAPLGAQLAHKGVISILMQYSLFPDVLAGDQAREVSQALLWVMNHVSDYGGDPSRIFLMGHSSGAHICAMALWERAKARFQGRPAGSAMTMGGGGGSGREGENGQSSLPSSSSLSSEEEWERATRQPHCFIGLSGVYDVGVHYRYEQERGAAAVSALRRAMGGSENFPHLSPALLFPTLKNYLPQPSSSIHNTPTQPKPNPSQQRSADPPPPSSLPPLPLPLPQNPHQKQNSIARHRHGSKFMRPGAAIAATSAALSSSIPTLKSDTIVAGSTSSSAEEPSSLKDNFDSDATTGLLSKRALKSKKNGSSATTFPLLSKWFSEHVGESMDDVRRNLRAEGCSMEESDNNGAASESLRAGVGSGKSLGRPRWGEDLVAPSILMCSPGDFVVPPTTSYQLERALVKIGCRAKVVLYDGVTHGDFIIWKKERRGEGRGGARGDSPRLGEHVEDIFEIVRESVLLDDLEWGI